MSSAISIVEATETDLPAIGNLLTELVDAMDDSKDIDLNKALENCRTLLSDSDSHFLVAKVGGSTVGFVNFTIRKTALQVGPSGLIDELIVAKKHRGQGIGRRLVSAAIDRCRQFGCCEIEVSTEKSNTRARDFYKSCGFEEDAVLLEIHLDERNAD